MSEPKKPSEGTPIVALFVLTVIACALTAIPGLAIFRYLIWLSNALWNGRYR